MSGALGGLSGREDPRTLVEKKREGMIIFPRIPFGERCVQGVWGGCGVLRCPKGMGSDNRYPLRQVGRAFVLLRLHK